MLGRICDTIDYGNASPQECARKLTDALIDASNYATRIGDRAFLEQLEAGIAALVVREILAERERCERVNRAFVAA
jgi:hypothetical protein